MLFISKLFLCFLIFSFAGWVLEVLYGLYELKKFVNRGFLFGPLCPLYGVGCLSMALLLSNFENNLILLFILSMLICSLVEYLASYLLEKIFKIRWWDYSNFKYNINGRICLEMMVPFGILGVLVVKFLFPLVYNALGLVPNIVIYVSSTVLLILFLVDLSFSLGVAIKFKNTALKVAKDSTEEISKFIKELLSKKNKKRIKS